MRVILDTSGLQRLERQVPGRAEAVVQKIAQDAEADIKTSFSQTSPAPPGAPPGVDTGALKNSIMAEKDPTRQSTWILHDGVHYGVSLEYGTKAMAARPFFLPAVRRAASRIDPNLLREVVE